MDKWYWGFRSEQNDWELFTSDEPYVTAASSGYEEIYGPYATKEEAEADNPND